MDGCIDRRNIEFPCIFTLWHNNVTSEPSGVGQALSRLYNCVCYVGRESTPHQFAPALYWRGQIDMSYPLRPDKPIPLCRYVPTLEKIRQNSPGGLEAFSNKNLIEHVQIPEVHTRLYAFGSRIKMSMKFFFERNIGKFKRCTANYTIKIRASSSRVCGEFLY